MTTAFMCADLHLGHRGIIKYRDFRSVEDHDGFVEHCWRSRVRKKNQTVYLLGDVAFDKESWLKLDDWPGTKIIILGNHDTERVPASFIAGLKTVNAVHSMLKHKMGMLTHAPMHADHLRGARNIHGHLHGSLVRDRRYLNVSMEQIDYTPISTEEIEREFECRKSLRYVASRLGTKAALSAAIQSRKKPSTH